MEPPDGPLLRPPLPPAVIAAVGQGLIERYSAAIERLDQLSAAVPATTRWAVLRPFVGNNDEVDRWLVATSQAESDEVLYVQGVRPDGRTSAYATTLVGPGPHAERIIHLRLFDLHFANERMGVDVTMAR